MERVLSPPNAKSSELGHQLAQAFDNGLFTDMAFRVGPTMEIFKAHKVIVTARSEVFAARFQERWDSKSDDSSKIFDLPDASSESFRHFLKGLYSDGLPDKISLEHLLEVMDLMNMFQVGGLKPACFELLKSKVNLENCIQIYRNTRLYVNQEEMQGHWKAFGFLPMWFNSIVTNDKLLMLDEEEMSQLLEWDALNVEEAKLFHAVLRWRDHEVQYSLTVEGVKAKPRKESLKSLIKLIRFPLMGAKVFAKEVIPTGVLSDMEIIEMLLHFNGDMIGPLRFNSHRRIGSGTTDEEDDYDDDDDAW